MLFSSQLFRHYALLGVMSPALAFPASAAEIPSLMSSEAEVGFDIPQLLACRDVTTPEFSADHPEERLIEVRVPVSLLLYRGEPNHLKDVIIEVDGEPAELRVHDYSPRTKLHSDLSQPISEKETVAEDRSLGASVGAKIAADVAITPTLSGGYSKTETHSKTTHKLPPKQAVVVSGTTNSRRGVYFKLRRSSQSTLEGEHEFAVTFVAPRDWPGGEMEVRCIARGQQKWFFVEQRKVWNETSAPVELRLVSHTVAKPVESRE